MDKFRKRVKKSDSTQKEYLHILKKYIRPILRKQSTYIMFLEQRETPNEHTTLET